MSSRGWGGRGFWWVSKRGGGGGGSRKGIKGSARRIRGLSDVSTILIKTEGLNSRNGIIAFMLRTTLVTLKARSQAFRIAMGVMHEGKADAVRQFRCWKCKKLFNARSDLDDPPV